MIAIFIEEAYYVEVELYVAAVEALMLKSISFCRLSMCGFQQKLHEIAASLLSEKAPHNSFMRRTMELLFERDHKRELMEVRQKLSRSLLVVQPQVST